MKDFKGKVAAITGAGSGMGRALAISLANQGCHLALSDINEDNLEETVSSLAQLNVTASSHVLDVSNRHQVEKFAEDTVAHHGKVNMIFNNAGVSVSDTAEHMSYENIEWLMNINFWGVIYGTKSFLPFLQKVDEAHIINTSSIFGTIALPSQSAYNASKFAVRGYTYALRQELAETHIGVSCVQPGGVKTNIVNSSRYVPKDNAAETKDEISVKFESMAGLTSEQAAEQILRGVKKNKAQILVGKDAKIVALIERIAPIGYQWLLARLFKEGS
ncbi:MAG: SDR family NAD(P)-dependent oxidoreductase [Pseudomonadales bacterium]|nr:SDR family NAD(P)-dependent oxidoreductase [Pseudomonadales bacterium]